MNCEQCDKPYYGGWIPMEIKTTKKTKTYDFPHYLCGVCRRKYLAKHPDNPMNIKTKGEK